MTDFRARGTIMGPTGLTAVFGMGTGGTPPVSSPENHPRGVEAPRAQSGWSVTCRATLAGSRVHGSPWISPATVVPLRGTVAVVSSDRWVIEPCLDRWAFACWGLGVRIGVVKRSAVRTGRLRRSPAVHSRPIDLVVFQEPSQLLLPETSS